MELVMLYDCIWFCGSIYMDSKLFSLWRFAKDKLSIVVTEFTNVFGDSNVR